MKYRSTTDATKSQLQLRYQGMVSYRRAVCVIIALATSPSRRVDARSSMGAFGLHSSSLSSISGSKLLNDLADSSVVERLFNENNDTSESALGEDTSRGHKRRKKRRKIKKTSASPIFDLRCGGSDDSSGGGVEGQDSNALESDGADVVANESVSSETLIDLSVVDNENESQNPDEGVAEGEQHSLEDATEDNVDISENDANENNSNASDTDMGHDEEETGSTTENVDKADQIVEEEENSDTSTTDNEAAVDSTIEITPTDTTPSEILEKQFELRSLASDRRAEGKALHDSGDLNEAAMAFRDAAALLDEAISATAEHPTATMEDENDIAVERATCRLHEALCLLKDGRPGDCVEACSNVLGDGVAVIHMEEEDEAIDANSDVGDDSTSKPPVVIVKVVDTAPTSATHSSLSRSIPPLIRARAHHRRAKARLALGDLDGALEDARSAAFMGDRNAVAFYGRLMREGSGAVDNHDVGGGGLPSGWGNGMGGSSSNPFLDGILGGNTNNPFLPSPSAGAGSSDFSSSLLSSLLSSGSSNGGGGSPFGLMGELLAPSAPTSGNGKSRRRKGKKKGGMDSLAKSMLSNLMKRVEDEETQEQICRYLQSANKQQVVQFSSMAGIPMTEENASRLVSFANGVTPIRMRKTISKVKRGMKIVKTARKILKVIDKYKPVIILVILCYWIKSALLEPYPVSKREAKKLAQKAAASLVLN